MTTPSTQTLITATIMFLVILVVGYVLTLILTRKRGKSFNAKELRAKILIWIPIYAVFVLFILSNQFFQILVALFIAYHVIKEVRSHRNRGYPFLGVYFACFVGFGLIAVWLMSNFSLSTTLAIIFSTMMAEEFGYFALALKKKKGRRKVPPYRVIQSVESLSGQMIGASLAAIASYLLIGKFDLWIILSVIIGVVFGDAINRYIKSKLKIQTWSNRLGAHGGYLDRFAGLSFAAITVYIFYFL